MQRPHDELHLSLQEGEALIERLECNTLSAEDRGVLVQVVRWLFWLFFVVQEAKLSLKRLRAMLFGHGMQGTPSRVPEASSPSSALDAQETESSGRRARGWRRRAGPPPPRRSQAPWGHRRGTGRLGAEAYTGAQRVECRHEELAVGQRCPVCGQGTLYEVPPGSALRIDGHALLSALRYALQKLRCSACGEIFTAPLPAEAGVEKYSARARAVLAVSRYYLGLPFFRVEAYQSMLGVPVPDATQWDQIERVANCGYVVFAHLERLAAQGELIYQDDTTVRILSLIGENLQRRTHAEALACRGPRSAPACIPRRWWCRWASTRSACIIRGARMQEKTSRRS